MNFQNMIDENCLTTTLSASDKEGVLRKLAELACKSDKLRDVPAELIFTKLKEREDQGSTGFGKEIALPHARIEGMEDFLLFIAVAPRGVKFDAMDRKKVKIFFVILGPPEMANTHLKILATISRSIVHTTILNEMINAKTNHALLESFLKSMSLLEAKDVGKKTKMKLMFIILFIEDYLYDILELFIQEGIKGATISDSFGVGEYMYNVPIFAHFISFMKEDKNRSKTIMVMLPEDKVDTLVRGIEEITGDLDKKEGAMVFTLDVDFYKGSMEMM